PARGLQTVKGHRNAPLKAPAGSPTGPEALYRGTGDFHSLYSGAPQGASNATEIPRLRSTSLHDFAVGHLDRADCRARIERTAKNPATVALGRLGGPKGSKARTANLTAKQ